MTRTLRTTDDLILSGLVATGRREEIDRVTERYAAAITPAMAALMDLADTADPIARQFLPDGQELDHHPSELPDPIGDHAKSPVKGIVHRYPDRVLLKVASACPVYCRFCFRREMIGPAFGDPLSAAELAAALDYIGRCPAIWEVILTGGDPFILSPRRIAELTAALEKIPHVKILRWHTRVPVVAPECVSDELVAALTSGAKTVYVAVHANHPRELTQAARAACARLARAGVALVSQTVLLRSVNDDADTLEALMRAFVEARVKPYYLHHGDLAPGTSHFRVPIARGQALMRALRGRLSGLAQPAYVLDIPAGHGKVPVGPGYARAGADVGSFVLEDTAGNLHEYSDTSSE